MSKKIRICLYVALIGGIFLPWVAWETDRNMVRRWTYPITGYLSTLSTQCDADAPSWLQELAAQLPTNLDSPANQLMFVDKAGRRSGCVNGWEHYPLVSQRVTPSSSFRLASLSKIVTFFGVIHDQIDWLNQPLAVALNLDHFSQDQQIAQIQIRHLLNHSAGFDRMRAQDPMVINNRKPWCPGQIQELAQARLQFAPGSRHAYSNLGYCLAAVAYERHEGRSLWSALEHDMRLSQYGIGYMDQADSPVAYNFMHNELHGPEFVDHLDWWALRAPMGMTGSAQGLARFIADNRSLLDRSRGMHDSSIVCNETVPESCQDGFLERRRVGDRQVWLQRGYLYGMSALFLTDGDGNFIVWLGTGDLGQPLRASEFIEQAFLKSFH